MKKESIFTNPETVQAQFGQTAQSWVLLDLSWIKLYTFTLFVVGDVLVLLRLCVTPRRPSGCLLFDLQEGVDVLGEQPSGVVFAIVHCPFQCATGGWLL